MLFKVCDYLADMICNISTLKYIYFYSIRKDFKIYYFINNKNINKNGKYFQNTYFINVKR